MKAALPSRRLLLLLAVLALVLLGALVPDEWLDGSSRDDALPAAASSPEGGAGGAAPESVPATAVASADAAMAAPPAAAVPSPVDIFAVRTWEPPPPPPDLSPPPPPKPPPLPFRFLGRVLEPGKKPTYLLSDGAQTFAVSEGDAIGSTYRVEKLEKGRLYLRYRPMNARQYLDVRSEP